MKCGTKRLGVRQITFADTLQNGKEYINSLSPKEYLDNRSYEGS